MATQLLMRILIATSLFTTVHAQQPIGDKKVIVDGGTFTITCDISHLTSTDIPTYNRWLSIDRTVGASNATLIASYGPFQGPSSPNLTMAIPPGRDWVIEATGGVGSGTYPTNNKDTIKIVLTVKDAACADAGVYRCIAYYTTAEGEPGAVLHYQNIALTANTEDPVFTLDRHKGNEPDFSTNKKGENVFLSCKVRGPYGLVLNWLTGHPSGSNFSTYLYTDGIQMVTPSPPSARASPCNKYDYETTLNITVQSGETMYICVVTDGKVEVIRKNFTIYADTSTVVDGDAFTITCNARRLANLPDSVTRILTLSFERTVRTATRATVMAVYSPNQPQNLTTTIPPGRRWTITASGGEGPGAGLYNNTKTIKIELSIQDFRCDDAGTYSCKATFAPTSGIITAQGSQNVAVTVPPNGPHMTLDRLSGNDPYYPQFALKQHVVLICSALGPQSLKLEWGASDQSRSQLDDANVKDPEPVAVMCSSCDQYRHESRLYITQPHGNTQYSCTAKDGFLNGTYTVTVEQFLERQYVLDRPYFQEGGLFTVTCDASLFVDVPSNVMYISQLSVERSVGATTQGVVVASYVPFPHPGFLNLTTNIPTGRVWEVQATGGVGADEAKDDNRDTIRLTLNVTDAVCADVGTYRCVASYYSPTTGPGIANRSENITYRAKVMQHTITSSHHNGNVPDYSRNTVGENITLTCSILGYQSLELSWLYGPKNDVSCSAFQPADGTQVVPTLLTGSCLQYRHISTLTFTVVPEETTYVCIVRDVDAAVSRKDFTIGGQSSGTRSTGVSLSVMESNWFGGKFFLVELTMFLWLKFS